MKILITGISGELGQALGRNVPEGVDVFGSYYSRPVNFKGVETFPLDLLDTEQVDLLFKTVQPDVVIHTAISDQGKDTSAAIPTSARNLSDAVRRYGSRLIALSTDMVFDGRTPPYSEESPPTPLSAYGRAKRDAEALYGEMVENSLVVRTSLIYTLSKDCRQIGWMVNNIREGKTVSLFEDEFRNPVYADNLAVALFEVAVREEQGHLHIAGPTAMSRLEYGRKLLKAIGLVPDKFVEVVRAEELAPHRPRDLTLDLSKARLILSTRLVSLDEVIKTTPDQGQPISTTTNL